MECPSRTQMTRLSCISLAVLLSACASAPPPAPAPVGDPLGIAAPASGALTDAQLDRIAADIRRLEAAPLAPDASDARRVLLVWLINSPDVSITVCPSLSGMGQDERSPLSTALGMQSVFSEAAYRIETDGEVDLLDGRVQGVEGLLRAYEAARAADTSVSDSRFDRLRTARDRGALADAVRDADC